MLEFILMFLAFGPPFALAAYVVLGEAGLKLPYIAIGLALAFALTLGLHRLNQGPAPKLVPVKSTGYTKPVRK